MYNFLNAINFWRPVIYYSVSNKNTTKLLEINETSLTIRVICVAIGAFAYLTKLSISYVAKNPYSYMYAHDLSKLQIYATMCLAAIFFSCEKKRAIEALDERAIKIFTEVKSNEVIPDYVMSYLINHLSAIATLCKNNKQDLQTKKDKNGYNLIKFITLELKNSIIDYKRKDFLLTVMKLFIDQNLIAIDNNQFLEWVKKDNFKNHLNEIATYALKLKKVQLEKFTADQQVMLWTYCENSNLAQLLIEQGLDINIKNSTGKTCLENVLENKQGKNRLLFLLKFGAKLPVGFQNLQIINYSGEHKKIKESFKDDPFFIRTLEELDKIKKKFFFIPSSCSSVLALDKPAILVDTNSYRFEIQELNIVPRVMIVAIPIFASCILSLVVSSKAFIIALPISVLGLGLYNHFEWTRATKALNALAVQELSNIILDNGVTSYIAKSHSIITMIQSPNDLIKIDNRGHTLWSSICNGGSPIPYCGRHYLPLRIFQQLADQISSLKLSSEEKYYCFQQAIKGKNSQYVEYLLQAHIITPNDFTDLQHFECYDQASSKEIIAILNKHSFKVNAKNKDGLTPLYNALIKIISTDIHFSLYNRVKSLLKAGAEICLGETSETQMKLWELPSVKTDIAIKNLLTEKIK